jgi:hypothetical protein
MKSIIKNIISAAFEAKKIIKNEIVYLYAYVFLFMPMYVNIYYTFKVNLHENVI